MSRSRPSCRRRGPPPWPRLATPADRTARRPRADVGVRPVRPLVGGAARCRGLRPGGPRPHLASRPGRRPRLRARPRWCRCCTGSASTSARCRGSSSPSSRRSTSHRSRSDWPSPCACRRRWPSSGERGSGSWTRRSAHAGRTAASRGVAWRSPRLMRRRCASPRLGGAPLVTYVVAAAGLLLAVVALELRRRRTKAALVALACLLGLGTRRDQPYRRPPRMAQRSPSPSSRGTSRGSGSTSRPSASRSCATTSRRPRSSRRTWLLATSRSRTS